MIESIPVVTGLTEKQARVKTWSLWGRFKETPGVSFYPCKYMGAWEVMVAFDGDNRKQVEAAVHLHDLLYDYDRAPRIINGKVVRIN